MYNKKDILIAGAIGDAVGYIVEFMRLEKILRFWPTTGLRLEIIPEDKKLYVSDDTQMTLFTLEALQHIKRGLDPRRAYMHAFMVWYNTQLNNPAVEGLGSFKSMLERRAPGNTCLGALEQKAPIYSKGCGGVMRAAPCGFDYSIKEAFAQSVRQAEVTHIHPAGYLPAGVMAAMISALSDPGCSLNLALTYAIDELRTWPKHEETLNAIELAVSLAGKEMKTTEAIMILGEGWTGEEALAIALYAAMTAKSFEECISFSINHDGDSDSTGSIAAQIFVAAYGLPEQYRTWVDRLDIADAFKYITEGLDDAKQV